MNEGWSILLYSVLATLGHQELALEKALALPGEVFESAGGSGHSLSNTLWYIASRAAPSVPYDLVDPSTSIHSKSVPMPVKETLVNCGCPNTCAKEALEQDADGFSCKDRIQWLMTNKGLNELGACKQVAGNEYQSICGECNPEVCAVEPVVDESVPAATSGCPPCSSIVCASDINRCQIETTPYLCYEGAARGGCTAAPWIIDERSPCTKCCELFRGC